MSTLMGLPTLFERIMTACRESDLTMSRTPLQTGLRAVVVDEQGGVYMIRIEQHTIHNRFHDLYKIEIEAEVLGASQISHIMAEPAPPPPPQVAPKVRGRRRRLIDDP